MSISVDGFVGGPNGEIDWLLRRGLGTRVEEWITMTLWNASAHLMGRRTFNDMRSYWPFSDIPLAEPMNQIPKIAFSKGGGSEHTTQALKDATGFDQRTGRQPLKSSDHLASWNDAPIITSGLEQEILRLKQGSGKPLLAHGGAGFAQSLAATGLIDEYHLLVHPVVLGKGLPLFSAVTKPLDLQLASITVFDNGVAAHIYVVGDQ